LEEERRIGKPQNKKSEEPTNLLIEYDIKNQELINIEYEEVNKLQYRMSHTSVLYKNKMYIFGGVSTFFK
jgi:hypothetical protein